MSRYHCKFVFLNENHKFKCLVNISIFVIKIETEYWKFKFVNENANDD